MTTRNSTATNDCSSPTARINCYSSEEFAS
jgi:hypothetical protein